MSLQEIQETIEQLKDADEKIRSQAALSLGWIGDNEVIPHLIDSMQKDYSARVRANAALSLGQLNNKKAIPSLIVSLADEDAFVRGMVIYSLGLMKAEEATDALITVLENDIDREARMAAAEALFQIGDEKVIPVLIKSYIYDQEETVRNEAKHSLDILSKKLLISNIEALIEEEKSKVKIHQRLEAHREEIPKPLIVDDSERKKFLDSMHQHELSQKREELITYIFDELPKLLDYAIHNEIISFDKLSERFNCDDLTLELALTKLAEKKIIDVVINPSERNFTVFKSHANLSEEAIFKLKLIRKKFGIDF
ncbi:MAG: HEAT repeat domain-containing protein [Candidatus Heimdallarchaeota archaeon]|nr:HEAT repeat domain-containing protein [Candidatus Heimdallarchaeota archaeon]